MPRGGKRLGAGRKPKTRKERWLGGQAGHRPMPLTVVPKKPPKVFSADLTVQVVADIPAPAILTEDEQAYWQLWAPMADRRGLLTDDTIPGFAELCQVARRKAMLWSEIMSSGLVYEVVTVDGAGQERREFKKHPLLTEWRGLVKQTELLMSRFGLTGDGKVQAAEEQPDDERAELARLLSG